MRDDHREEAIDGGYTLVELLVAMGIFLVLMTMIMTSVLSISRATTDVRQFTNINEQARIAVERLTRELRQASVIRAVTLPPPATVGDVEITFGVDFNGIDGVEDAAADPEVLTYHYDRGLRRLTLTANADPLPILSEQVSAFTLEFRSSLWQYDTNHDGVTDWTEIDAAPGIGNQDGHLDDTAEFKRIDLVVVTLSVLEGPHRQTYETQVSLRNQAQS